MKIVAVLQARMSSSRLPGKVLKPLCGEPMLFRQIERLMRCKEFDHLMVATSTSETDDLLADECKKRGIECFRGSLDDVLDRFYKSINKYNPENIVRLTGDCPLADPVLIDEVIRFYEKGNYDYVCNCNPPTFPDGLDVEVMNYAGLKKSFENATLLSEREHVTLYMRSHTEKFKIGNYLATTDLSSLRWTVDEPEDFTFVEAIYNKLYNNNPEFTTDDILQLLKNTPTLMKLNSGFIRNEGLLRSLERDNDNLNKEI